MIGEIINGINYRLDEENLTAVVIELKEDFRLADKNLTAEQLMKAVFNGYEGDIIIPETVVFDEHTYRVTSIGKEAFAGSYSLKSITIPDSVTSIGDRAFEDCKNLKSITIPDYASIGKFAFGGCESLTSPVESGEKIIGGIKYILYCNRTAEVTYKQGYNGDINIPETVVFKDLTYRVTSIGESAFSYCKSLTSIVIPDSVTSIGECAFSWCSSLNKITISNSVTSIGKRAFESCQKLTSIIIPNNVKSIEDMALSWCYALTEIVIPNSVMNIGYEAFDGCKSLANITFQGTIAQWKEIALDENWKDKVPARVVHCTDGDMEI